MKKLLVYRDFGSTLWEVLTTDGVFRMKYDFYSESRLKECLAKWFNGFEIEFITKPKTNPEFIQASQLNEQMNECPFDGYIRE